MKIAFQVRLEKILQSQPECKPLEQEYNGFLVSEEKLVTEVLTLRE
jgi:hypothetical protein